MARVCAQPGCPQLTNGKRPHCDDHERERQRLIDARRPSARKRGYDSRWEKARKAFLAKHRLCWACEAEGRRVIAREVDHDPPHGGNMTRFWDRKTWRPMCKSHHSAKTLAEINGRKFRPKGCDERGFPNDPGSHWYR